MRRFLATLIAIASLPSSTPHAQSDTPGREEQLIYSILAYNGRDYSPTFCRAGEQLICVVAEADSFLSVRTSLVYFWPATGEWHTDSKTLNVMYEGNIELSSRRGGKQAVLTPVRYTYFNRQGRYNQNWEVALGEEAAAERSRYEEMVNRYQLDMEAYTRRRAAWEREYARLATDIAARREKGEDVEEDLARLEAMREPEEPKAPDAYLVPPAEVRTGYVLHLSPGTYSMRFRDPDGLILEGSEKTVVAFGRHRTDQIGYDIIPSDRWTRVEESATPSSVLYLDGTADLYLRPFLQDEYNDLYYRKAMENDAAGNPNLMTWAKVQQLRDAEIEVGNHSGSALVVSEKPFYVEQTPGTALGYTIVPFDPEGRHVGKQPTLQAFHIPVVPTDGVIDLRLKRTEGGYLPGGERQIRVVQVSRHPYAFFPLCLLPMAAFALVLLARRHRQRAFDRGVSDEGEYPHG